MQTLDDFLKIEENKAKWDLLWGETTTIRDFLLDRFKSWFLLYEGESWWTVLGNYITTHALEFKKINYFLGLEIEQLGQISNSETSAETDATGNNNQSYSGYGVDGEFAKSTNASNQQNHQSQMFQVINNLELIKRNLSELYDVIEADFKKFFITLF